MLVKKISITLLLCLFCLLTKAQQLISEGTITYKISISGKVPSPDGHETVTETKKGTLTIIIKGGNVREDIALEDGYQHSQITNFTTGKEIILQPVNNLKYAIEINISEKKDQNSQYFNAVIKLGKEAKTFGGYEANSATITYKNKTTLPLFILPGFYLNYPEIFERFPEIKGIPASYDLVLDNGFTTHFDLSEINEKPVDNVTFRIPVGYRIIKQKEYEKLIR